MSGASPLFVCEKSKADSIHASSLYYQHKPERLPACLLTIHALLHIPDQIRWMGPCWTTWAFPIERQCGYFQRSIQSRRNPYVSMDQHLTDLSQLRQIKILYNLTDEQLGKPPKDPSSRTKSLEDCKSRLSTITLLFKDNSSQTHNTNSSLRREWVPLIRPFAKSSQTAWRPGSVSRQGSPGNFFQNSLSNGANCIALKVETSCTRMILFPNAWTAEMRLSSVCVS